MRNKLALTIALASFGVVTALGVGLAGAEQPTSAESHDAASHATPAVPAAAPPACSTDSMTTATAWSTSKTPTAPRPP